MSSDSAALQAILVDQQSIQQWQDDLYVHFHRHPELSYVEHQTHDRIAAELGEIGVDELVEHIGDTGVVGVLRNGDGPTVLMRADIDALPVSEATGLDYASTATGISREGEHSPVMHACGHDVHICALLGAARLLAAHRDKWSGVFIALFQPAEERAGGALAMVADGLVDRIPRPDVALAQHVTPHPSGQVHACEGSAYSRADSITVTVFGRGGHGSYPQSTVDPVVLAASIVLRLQTIVSRETRPGEFAVVTVGRLQVGTKSNIIADRAVLEVNVRSYDDDVHARILASIERIVRAECDASGSPTPPTFAFYDRFPVTLNDDGAVATVRSAFSSAFGDDFVEEYPSTASEDVSEIAKAFGIPLCYWNVGGSDRETYFDAQKRDALAETIPMNHSPYFAPVMHPTLPAATKAIIVASLAWLGTQESEQS